MALKHIVWLKARPGTGDDALEPLLARVRGFAGHLPGIVDVTAGANLTDRALGYTHGVIVTLTGMDALEPYLEHPDHQAVSKELRAHCEVLAMDFED